MRLAWTYIQLEETGVEMTRRSTQSNCKSRRQATCSVTDAMDAVD